ncbi:BH3-interacting domain death agonist isoform X2 [Xenopus laevis]|uniref:BH3-interacting domain death agonist n=1 Tax=Xenopus laevis TaxID=8355 RepID=A0A8J0U3V7_XENLA|nr:BH3-interacting domain death agonist isoform X2 [Xenopus laevis]
MWAGLQAEGAEQEAGIGRQTVVLASRLQGGCISRMTLSVEKILLSYLEIDLKNNEVWEELNLFSGRGMKRGPMRQQGVSMRCCEGDLETDGNVPLKSTDIIQLEEEDEELCRRIAAQLAEIGDKLEREMKIKPEVVDGLVDAMLNNTLDEEHLAATVQSLVQTAPPGVEQELATVAVAMILTKKAVTNAPSLLHNICHTTTQFVERNYRACLERLARQR